MYLYTLRGGGREREREREAGREGGRQEEREGGREGRGGEAGRQAEREGGREGREAGRKGGERDRLGLKALHKEKGHSRGQLQLQRLYLRHHRHFCSSIYR
jgi:hypothetical protein